MGEKKRNFKPQVLSERVTQKRGYIKKWCTTFKYMYSVSLFLSLNVFAFLQ